VQVLRFQGDLWLTLGNGGGATNTTQFLHKHLPKRLTVKWPFHEAEGWFDSKDYLAGTDREITLEDVLALKELPESDVWSDAKVQECEAPPTWDARSLFMDQIAQMLSGTGVKVMRDVRLDALPGQPAQFDAGNEGFEESA
jgi:hypothetical protein